MLIDIDSLDRAHYGPVHVRGWAGDSGCQEAGEPQSREASGAGAGDPFPRVRRRGSWARRVVSAIRASRMGRVNKLNGGGNVILTDAGYCSGPGIAKVCEEECCGCSPSIVIERLMGLESKF